MSDDEGDRSRHLDAAYRALHRYDVPLHHEGVNDFDHFRLAGGLLHGPLSVSEEETLAAVGADLQLTRVQVTGVVSMARQGSGH